MAQIIPARDTIFEHPAFNNFPINPGSVQGGRLMSSGPHVDGLYMAAPEILAKDSANLALTRNGVGDWSLNRTAAGAETYNVRTTLGQILRIGEQYNLGLFPGTNQTTGPNAPDKGLAVLDFFAIYSVGVVALTTATLRLGKTVFSKTAGGAAFTQTNLVAATGIQTATTPAAGQPVYQNVAFQNNSSGTPLVFHKDDLGLIEVEAVFVMANTGTLRVYGLGCHAFFNYT